MQMLKSPKADARRLAAESLGKQKVLAAIPGIAGLLKDDVEVVREAAVDALVQMGPRAVPDLSAALKYPREDSKVAALRALRLLGPDAKPAVPAITLALKDRSVDVRIHAASVLGNLKVQAKPALPALFAAAKDMGNLGAVVRPNLPSSVTEAAIAAALEIDDQCAADLAKAALPALTAALQNKNEAVVLAAGNALAKLGQNAKPALSALEKAYKRSTGLAETTLSQAILAVGGDGTTVLTEIVGDAKAPLEKRLKALSQLGWTGRPDDRVVSVLVNALHDSNPQMRAGAAMALAMIGPKARGAIPALVELLADETLDAAADKLSAGATKVVPQALTRMGSEAVPALAALLKDDSKTPFARWQAAGTLANLRRRATPALPVLEAALKDKNLLIAGESACAYVLAGGDAARAMPVLKEGLKDKSPLVLWHTIDAIRRLGPKAKDTVPLLTVLLKHEDQKIRIAAAHALSNMGPDARPAVAAMAQLLQPEDPRQRLEIILALGRLGPNAKEALPALIQRLKDMQPLSHHPLLITIGEFGSDAKDAVPALMELLKKKEIIFHSDAMIALGQIGPEAQAAVPQLQAFLGHASEYPRANAARALGGIGPKAESAVPALKKLLQDDRQAVRVWAAYALARVTGDNKPYVAVLVELWKANPDDEYSLANSVRYEVAQALELLGAEARPARAMLLEALSSDKTPPGTQMYVARALGHLADDAEVIVPKLLELLDRKGEGYARVANCMPAIQSLGMLGPRAKAAIPRLRQLAQDNEDEIADAAAWALGKIEAK